MQHIQLIYYTTYNFVKTFFHYIHYLSMRGYVETKGTTAKCNKCIYFKNNIRTSTF